MTGLHESTLALSVYTAIQRRGSMSREQMLVMLREAWDARLEPVEIDEGIEYLITRKMVIDQGGVVAASIVSNGAAATVVRDPRDQTELRVVVRRQA